MGLNILNIPWTKALGLGSAVTSTGVIAWGISENGQKNTTLMQLEEKDQELKKSQEKTNEQRQENQKIKNETLQRWWDSYYKEGIWKGRYFGRIEDKREHLVKVCNALGLQGCSSISTKKWTKLSTDKKSVRSGKVQRSKRSPQRKSAR